MRQNIEQSPEVFGGAAERAGKRQVEVRPTFPQRRERNARGVLAMQCSRASSMRPLCSRSNTPLAASGVTSRGEPCAPGAHHKIDADVGSRPFDEARRELVPLVRETTRGNDRRAEPELSISANAEEVNTVSPRSSGRSPSGLRHGCVAWTTGSFIGVHGHTLRE